jgi:flagellar assembly protein FliH
MSSRARRLAGAGAATAFAWAPLDAGCRPAVPSAVPAAFEVVDPVPVPVSPSPDQLRHEHRERLDAIEREAFASGYAHGERAGLEAGHARAEAMLRRLAQTLDELRSLRETMIRQTEQQMIELALAIAHRILRRESALDGDLIVAMARVALERLGEAAEATIRLNPEDYAHTVQRHGDHWAGAKVRVIADPAVGRGGCLVESDFGFIDAGVEAQFDEVMRALIGERAEPRRVHATAA